MSVLLLLGGAAGQTVTVGQATETDTAQIITTADFVGVVQVTETDLAQPIAWSPKSRLVNRASEIDLAQALSDRVAVAQANETDLAQTITATLVYATRFYLRKTAAAEVSPTISGTDWPTSSGIRRLMDTSTLGGDTPADDAGVSTVTNVAGLHRQYVSKKLAAGNTFVAASTAFKAQVQAFESGTNDNIFSLIQVKIVSSDGATLRKQVLTKHNAGSFNTEWSTTQRNKVFADGIVVDLGQGYTTVQGDRLVVEFGHIDNAGSTITGTTRWGSDGSDLPELDETDTDSSKIPWFEVNLDLEFFTGEVATGQATETDAAQAIAAERGLRVSLGQATETDVAQRIGNLTFGMAEELDRAKQIAVIGGLQPIADAPVLIRAPRKAGRIFHEFTSPSGDGFHPTVGEWSSEEEAPGGFMGASGQISRTTFHTHREVFRPGCLWRTFLEDGTCLFAGRLKSPDPDGSIVQLAAEGRGHIADKVIGPILYQTHVGSELSDFGNQGRHWSWKYGTMSHTNVDTGIVFTRSAEADTDNAGAADVLIPFFGREVAHISFHLQGTQAALEVLSSQRSQFPSNQTSQPSAELDINPSETISNWYIEIGSTSPSYDRVRIDLTIGGDAVQFPNIYPYEFTNYTGTAQRQHTDLFAHLIEIQVTDGDSAGLGDDSEILVSNIEVNGAPVGRSRRYGVGDLVEDVAARLGFHSLHFGGAYDITPYELPPGGTAAEALDMASLLSGKRWRILDTGAHASFEFGRYADHAWSLASPWSPLRTIPEERFDAVAVPFEYPGTHGQLTDQVVVRVEDSPFVVKRVAWDVGLSEPSHNKDKAIDLGALLADWLVRARYSGDFAAAEVHGPDGEKLSAHHVNAGDILRPWRSGEPGALRIGKLTRFEDHVEGEFDGESKTLTRILERRAKRLADRKG